MSNPEDNISSAPGTSSTQSPPLNVVANNKIRIKEENIPKFSGKETGFYKARNYIEELKYFKQEWSLSDEQTCFYARKGLSGKALDWYEANWVTSGHGLKNFTKFCQDFQSEFAIQSQVTENLSSLAELTQRDDESITQFYYRCTKTVDIAYERIFAKMNTITEIEGVDEPVVGRAMKKISQSILMEFIKAYWLYGANAEYSQILKSELKDIEAEEKEKLLEKGKQIEKDYEQANKKKEITEVSWAGLGPKMSVREEVQEEEEEEEEYEQAPFFTRGRGNRGFRGRNMRQRGTPSNSRGGNNNVTQNDKCFSCGRPGHFARECYIGWRGRRGQRYQNSRGGRFNRGRGNIRRVNVNEQEDTSMDKLIHNSYPYSDQFGDFYAGMLE